MLAACVLCTGKVTSVYIVWEMQRAVNSFEPKYAFGA
jgi:hypothetical protein